jgi:hypothetical protein
MERDRYLIGYKKANKEFLKWLKDLGGCDICEKHDEAILNKIKELRDK